jgi:hypothetical protein
LKGTNKGVDAAENGRFEISTETLEGTLIVSYVGYQIEEIPIRSLDERPCKTILLSPLENTIGSVIIKEYLADGIDQKDGGNSITIHPARLSAMPGSVEPDILGSIQMLPGIFSPNETASGLHIRGGTPDQNLILYDGIPVYHSGHFFGMISAFNPYVVENVDVYRSGVSSEYGGRASGVIDIHSENEVKRKFGIGVGFNWINGHLDLDVPLWNNSSISLSSRRSFTDSWATPTFLNYAEKVFQGTKVEDGQFVGEGVEVNDKYYFSDFNFKWLWQPGKNKFAMHFFAGLNRLDYNTEIPIWQALSSDILNLENGGFGLSWERQWKSNFKSKFRFTSAEYDYKYSLSLSPLAMPDTVAYRFGSTNLLTDQGVHLINEWSPLENQTFKFGYQFTDNKVDIGLSSTGLNQMDNEERDTRSILHTLFAEYHFDIIKSLHLNLGVRYQYNTVLNKDYFEPRVDINAKINDHVSLKLSSSKEIWIASDTSGIPVIESNQWTGGIVFNKGDWTVDVEGYVKELVGITSLSNSFANIPEQPFSQGNSRIRGVDVLVKKRVKNYRSWISYTLSNALYEFENINEQAFPATHDQRHALQWVHLVTKNKWEYSIGWQIRSGLPFTNVSGVDIITNPVNGNQIPRLIYEEPNGEQLKTYHRLDASVMYNFGNGKNFSGFTGLSLLNIYGRKNVLGREFLLGEQDPLTEEYNILQIDQASLKFTPNIVLRLQWR